MKSILVFKNNKNTRMRAILSFIIIAAASAVLFYKDLTMLRDMKPGEIYKIIVDKGLPILQGSAAPVPNAVTSLHTWPLQGTITSLFGVRGKAVHEGVDIAAPEGTPVCAFMDGTVVFSGWEGGYGNLVVIDHGGGVKTYYGHNSTILVRKNQHVARGQYISRVGSTGDSTGPHCHFEIRIFSIAVDPMDYFK